MVGLDSWEPSFSRKVPHDDFHHVGIPIHEVRERKEPFSFILVPWLDIWVKVMTLQVLFLVPFFTNIWNYGGIFYDVFSYYESDTIKGYLFIMKIRDEKPAQNTVRLDPLYFFTKVKASYMLETCHCHGRGHEFSGVCRFNSDDVPSFVWPPLFPFFFLTKFFVFFFHSVLARNPREMNWKWNVCLWSGEWDGKY